MSRFPPAVSSVINFFIRAKVEKHQKSGLLLEQGTGVRTKFGFVVGILEIYIYLNVR